MAFLANLAFIATLAGPDLILILVVVLLLFGARKFPDLARGMAQAVRELFGSEDEDEPEIKWRRTVRPPHGATHPLMSRFATPFLIVMLLFTLCLFLIWLNNGP
jgi:sec-independent protein translocase protein TatA